MTVVVFGSLNMDLVVRSARLPVPGETISGRQFATIAGGKGANQAVAVARQRVPTVMVGRVGADRYGPDLCQALANEGIRVDGVSQDSTVATGIAAIAVADSGANQIIVVPGANGQVGLPELEYLKGQLAAAECLLLQLEIPLSTVTTAAQLAHAAGLRVILDPAPAPQADLRSLYPHIDILTPNQVEAAQLVGFPVETIAQAHEAISVLRQQGVATVIIKLGEQGILCSREEAQSIHLPALPVSAVDTVAAGDAFNGGLAVALQAGKSLPEALHWAVATAAWSVTQPGAQPSLPTRSQVTDLINSLA
ncbi:MAG: ribokinase [Cyanobacteria bacterium P01_H01_bin.162]